MLAASEPSFLWSRGFRSGGQRVEAVNAATFGRPAQATVQNKPIATFDVTENVSLFGALRADSLQADACKAVPASLNFPATGGQRKRQSDADASPLPVSLRRRRLSKDQRAHLKAMSGRGVFGKETLSSSAHVEGLKMQSPEADGAASIPHPPAADVLNGKIDVAHNTAGTLEPSMAKTKTTRETTQQSKEKLSRLVRGPVRKRITRTRSVPTRKRTTRIHGDPSRKRIIGKSRDPRKGTVHPHHAKKNASAASIDEAPAVDHESTTRCDAFRPDECAHDRPAAMRRACRQPKRTVHPDLASNCPEAAHTAAFKPLVARVRIIGETSRLARKRITRTNWGPVRKRITRTSWEPARIRITRTHGVPARKRIVGKRRESGMSSVDLLHGNTDVHVASANKAPVVDHESASKCEALRSEEPACISGNRDEVCRVLRLRKDSFSSSVEWAFTVLGVGAQDGLAAVRRAYRQLMRSVHPDKAGSCPEAARAAEMVGAARDVCSRHLEVRAKPPDAPSCLTCTVLSAVPGKRRLRLRWQWPRGTSVQHFEVAVLDPAMGGQSLTLARLEPETCACDRISHGALFDNARNRRGAIRCEYTLAEEELTKLPHLFQLKSVVLKVAVVNEAGTSLWNAIKVAPQIEETEMAKVSAIQIRGCVTRPSGTRRFSSPAASNLSQGKTVPRSSPLSPTTPRTGIRPGTSVSVKASDAGVRRLEGGRVVCTRVFNSQLLKLSGVELPKWLQSQRRPVLAAWLQKKCWPTDGSKQDLVDRVIFASGAN